MIINPNQDISGKLDKTGTAAAATKLATARTIRTDLASTSAASFNGTANVTPGVTGVLPITNGGTGNDSGYIRVGQQAGTTIGSRATAEGYIVTASGKYSHAEGFMSKAAGEKAHAEGAETKALDEASHAEGCVTEASAPYSHAEGYKTKAQGRSSHAEGWQTIAVGVNSHAGGEGTTANYNQTVVGKYNVVVGQPSSVSDLNTETLFIVGKGSSDTSRANCFRVAANGVYATGAHNTTGADYAELFEWLDGNPEGADRCGRFVTLDGEKIRLAGPGDDFILGIVSGNPSVVGDVHDDQWQGMYLYDVFGRPLWEDVEVPDQTIEEPDPEDPEKTITHVIIPAHIEHRQRLNPAYDGSQPYQPRTQRPEWDAVGMLGKLVAVDDGTCEVNGWCTVGEDGAATHSAARTRYRVMARLDECHVRVLIL